MKLNRGKITGTWEKLCSWLWIGLVVSLPISSFPFFAKLLHTSSVAPTAGIFVLLLTIIWLPVFIIRGGRFPFQVKPALLFTFYCLFTIAFAFFRQAPFYPGSSILFNSIEAVATLGLGFLFYITAAGFPDQSKQIKNTLKALNWGGALLLGWSLMQFVLWLPAHDFPEWMRQVQRFFSTTVLFDQRTTGFASEPSWLAHMLNLVYLPYWLGATLKRYSAHKPRIWFLTLENIFLALGFIVLFLTFSRGGLVAFMLVLGFLFIRLNVQFIRWIIRKWQVKKKALLAVSTGLVMVLIYVGIGIGGLFALSKIDPRMETVFQFSSGSENSLVKYIDNLQFGERVAYWQTGWNIFNDHPLTGVGLNYSGTYFPKYLPAYAWQLTETRDLMYRTNNLLNIKNLWSRLLGETGIIGFSLFVTLLATTLITAIVMIKQKKEISEVIGWMGIFMLIAFIGEGFSVDSLALPYYWFTLGFVAATWRWSNITRSKQTDGQI